MKRHALFVGVNLYDDPKVRNLNFAIPDASVLSDRFRNMGYKTFPLSDPTEAELKRAVLKATDGLGRGDIFLFFFAGHGFTEPSTEHHLLFCRDSLHKLLGYGAGVRVDAIETLTEEGGFNRAFFLDSCRTDCLEGMGDRGSGETRDLDIVQIPDVRPESGSFFLLRSCNKRCPALEFTELGHGLFTQALLEALNKRDERLAVCDAAFSNAIRERMEDIQTHFPVDKPQCPSIGNLSGTPFSLFGREFITVSSFISPSPVPPASAHSAMSDAQVFVECPVCYANVPKAGTHNCKKCGRPNVCGNCWDAARKCCSECAAGAKAAENAKIAKAKAEAEAEARRKAAEEARRRAAEEVEAAIAKERAEAEARRRAEAEAEARRKAEEEARRRAEAEARRKAEAEARRRAEEEARRRAEAEARRRAEEEARRRAEEEARRRAEAEARRKAEEEARRRAEEVLSPSDFPSISDLPAPPDISDLPNWDEEAVDEEYSVRLVKVPGASRKKVIEIVRRWTGLAPADARDLVDGLKVIKSGISADKAGELKRELTGVKAAVSITPDNPSQPRRASRTAGASGNGFFRVVLRTVPDNIRGNVIKLLREEYGFHYPEAERLVKGGGVVREMLSREEAESMAKAIRNRGGEATASQQTTGVASARMGTGSQSGGSGVPARETAFDVREDAEDFYATGVKYYSGRNGVRQDYVEAAKWFRQSASRGHAKAQNFLGLMYDEGKGLEEDDEEAVKWYRLAAEQGYAPAQSNLGMMYDNGEGVEEDDEEAVKWYRLAAEQGHAGAQFNLGMMYENGEGVEEDIAEAAKWYRMAAEQGNEDARKALERLEENAERLYQKGEDFYNGRNGVRQDYASAVKWYRQAAEKGNAAAQYMLGVCYDNGEGIPKDVAKAVEWYGKAAENGNANAQFCLGTSYVTGAGVPKDFNEALMWLRKAAAQGNALAQKALRQFGVR